MGNKFCTCHDSEKHGQTSVMCCNKCGLPDEEFWHNPASLNRQGWTRQRRFSIEEMKQCWMDAFGFAGKEAYKTKGFIHPVDAVRDYFKNKFNIDV